jgi:hypothetical protein
MCFYIHSFYRIISAYKKNNLPAQTICFTTLLINYLHNHLCRSSFVPFVLMSVRHKEGTLDVRAGFIFESKTYKYTLDELIGDGGYGQVYEAVAVSKRQETDTKSRMAVKLEKRSSATDVEVRVLETAKEKNCRHIPRIFDHVCWIYKQT